MNSTQVSTMILNDIPGFISLIKDEVDSNILKLNKIKCVSSNNQEYKVIRYDKNMLTNDLIPIYGKCRSVIVNKNNDVVCFSPPKSISFDKFVEQYPSKTSDIIFEEFVEGTMINVFWDSNIGLSGAWEISTRNTVGATSCFFKNMNTQQQTFRDMFLEAASYNNLSLDSLNKEYCYSFVLQHPNNRIVVPFKHPQLYLVACYSIKNIDGTIYVCSYPVQDIKQYFIDFTKVKFPELYNCSTYDDLVSKYASMNTPYNVVGAMIHNRVTGERTKVRNPVYEQVKQLRGNQPKLQYQYLCLRKEGKVADFLKYYPENKKDFSIFRDQVHAFTNTLFSNYVSCYIKKEKPLNQFSDQYRTHMYTIHQVYMNDLKPKNLYVTNTVVIKYVNELHPSLLMYCLNYNMRKRNVDTMVAKVL